MDIALTSAQHVHAQKLMNIFLKYHLCLDTSLTGLGKSIIFIWIMKQLQVKNIILLCPLSIMEDWENYKNKYQIPIKLISTYESFRGMNSSESIKLKHNLLFRHSDGSFEVTPEFQQLVEEGVVIMCDELSKLKNECDVQSAVMMCNRYICHRRSIAPNEQLPFSGFYGISTTPFDRPEHCLNWCYTCGIITNPQLVSKETGTHLGIKQLYDFCLQVNSEKSNLIWGTVNVYFKNAFQVAYQLCVEIILPAISSFIIIEENDNKQQIIFNAYMRIPPIAMNLMKVANSIIHSHPMYINEEIKKEFQFLIDGIYPPDEVNLHQLENKNGLVHGFIMNQSIKAKYMYSIIIRKCLSEVTNCKVVVFASYREPIAILEHDLAEFSPLVITGSDSLEIRQQKKDLFQQINLNYRVIILMASVGSVGIELDDKDGAFPRIGFEIPDYQISNYVQSPGRICRRLTKSKSLFFFLKILSEEDFEASMNRNIDEKSKVFLETLKENGIISPNRFQILYDIEQFSINDLFNFEITEVKVEPKKTISKGIVIKRSSIQKSYI